MTNDIHWTENEEMLDDYVLGRVEPSLKDRLEKHLASCAHCKKRVESEASLADGVRQFAAGQTREQLQVLIKRTERDIPWPHILSMAAALFLIIGIGFYNRWFMKPTSQSTPLDSAEGKQKINSGTEVFQSPDADEDPRLRSESAETPVVRDRKSGGEYLKPKEPAAAPSGLLDDRVAEMDELTETRPHMLTGFLLREPNDEIGKTVKPLEQESAGDATILGSRERSHIANQPAMKRTGNLVIHWKDENGSNEATRTGRVRCSMEQIDSLFHLTLFLDWRIHIVDPLKVRATLVAPDSLVLLLDQSLIGLGLPAEFRGLIVPAD